MEGAAFALWRSVFSEGCADSILGALERAREWRRETGDFYELDVLRCVDGLVGSFTAEFVGVATEAHQRATMWLGKRFNRSANIRAHRFVCGTGAALHSDALEPGVRLVTFFSRASPEWGGALVFADPETRQAQLIKARHNLGVLFST